MTQDDFFKAYSKLHDYLDQDPGKFFKFLIQKHPQLKGKSIIEMFAFGQEEQVKKLLKL